MLVMAVSFLGVYIMINTITDKPTKHLFSMTNFLMEKLLKGKEKTNCSKVMWNQRGSEEKVAAFLNPFINKG